MCQARCCSHLRCCHMQAYTGSMDREKVFNIPISNESSVPAETSQAHCIIAFYRQDYCKQHMHCVSETLSLILLQNEGEPLTWELLACRLGPAAFMGQLFILPISDESSVSAEASQAQHVLQPRFRWLYVHLCISDPSQNPGE